MTNNEDYLPDEGMLDIFGRALGKKELHREQQRMLLSMCNSDSEIRDLLYFLVVKRRVPMRDIEPAIKCVDGLHFALIIDRLRQDVIEKEAKERDEAEARRQSYQNIFRAPSFAVGT